MDIQVTDDGVAELMLELEDFAMNLQNTTETSLSEIARVLPREIQNELRSASKDIDTRGTLRDSIRATASSGRLNFEMIYYGYYQVFGVSGKRVGALGIPSDILEAFNNSGFGSPKGTDRFQFTNNHPGIKGVPSAKETLGGLTDLIIATILED